MLGTMGSTIQALRSVLGIDSQHKRIEARGITAEYFFPHSPVPRVLDSDGADDGHTRDEHCFIRWCTSPNFRGAYRCASMDSGASPQRNRLEWTAVPLKLIVCTQLHKI